MLMRRQFLWVAVLLAVSALPIFHDDFLFSDDYYWFDIQHSRPFSVDREATQMNIADAAAIAAFALVLRGRIIAPLLLMVAALSTYQPHAMIYFALVAFWLAYTPDLSLRAIARPFGVGFGSLVLYFPFAKSLVKLYDSGAPARGELVIAPLEKLRWFAEGALPFSAKLWSIILSGKIAGALMAAAFLTAIVLGRNRLNLRRVLLVCAALVLTMLPHLVVRETVTRWRVVLPLSVGILLVWAVRAREVRCGPRTCTNCGGGQRSPRPKARIRRATDPHRYRVRAPHLGRRVHSALQPT